MKELKRILSNTKPNIIENLGNGNWYYYYDIQPVKREVYDQNTKKEESVLWYNFFLLKISEKPTYKKCVEKLIRHYISESEEFDLLNSACSDLLAGLTESNNITKYKESLATINEIKTNVAKDLEKDE
jgi:hypothetical protein